MYRSTRYLHRVVSMLPATPRKDTVGVRMLPFVFIDHRVSCMSSSPRQGLASYHITLKKMVLHTRIATLLRLYFLLFTQLASTVFSWPNNDADLLRDNHDYYAWNDDNIMTSISAERRVQDCGDCQQSYRIAFLGTSITYYNGLPNILGKLFEDAGFDYTQRSVLRSGSSFVGLWNKTFNTIGSLARFCPYLRFQGPTNLLTLLDDGPWDYVVMQDNMQVPARIETRGETAQYLEQNYVPLLVNAGVTPILFQTWAYKEEGVKDSEDLGNYTEFHYSVVEGYQVYYERLHAELQSFQQKKQEKAAAAAPAPAAPGSRLPSADRGSVSAAKASD